MGWGWVELGWKRRGREGVGFDGVGQARGRVGGDQLALSVITREAQAATTGSWGMEGRRWPVRMTLGIHTYCTVHAYIQYSTYTEIFLKTHTR